MQCDEPSLWYLFEQQYCEFSQQNEQLRLLLRKIGKALMAYVNSQNKMDDGTFQMGSTEFDNCTTYIEDLDQWLSKYLGHVQNVNGKITGIFAQLQQTVDQLLETVEKKKTEWKTSQRLAMLGSRAEKVSESGLEESNPDFRLLCQSYDETEKAIVYLLSLSNQYSSTFRDMSNWDNVSVVTMRLQMERTNLCQQVQQYVRQKQHLIVQKSFILVKQPPAIVRRSPTAVVKRTPKDSKVAFDLVLRVLAGASYGLFLSNVHIELLLISEKHAQDIVNEELDPLQENLPVQGQLLDPGAILQPCGNPNHGKMFAVIQNVRVKSMKNQDAEENDVLYHILLRTKHEPNSAGTVPQFWTISMPFAIVSNAHGQDKVARARAFWRMSFKIDDRTSLANVDKEIRWCEFFPALDQWFRNTVEKGCQKGLKDHSVYIAGKLGVDGEPESVVTWDTFYKKKIGDAQLTFWTWLYPIADYLAQVPEYWNSRLILGFVSRLDAERLLRDKTKKPSMVLRFSESNPGKMVVSYFVPAKHRRLWSKFKENEVMEHVLFDEKALEGKTLAQCIQLSPNLSIIKCILPDRKHVRELFTLDATSSDKQSGPKSSKWGYVLPRVTLVWDPLPNPPKCLMKDPNPDDTDDERETPKRAAKSPPEFVCDVDTLNDVEFKLAAESLSEYLYGDALAEEFDERSRITD